jgi:hypothetical protein
MVVADGDGYRVGTVQLGTGSVVFDHEVAKGSRFTAAAAAARRSREGRAFLHWARFPAAIETDSLNQVRLYDLRYSDGRSPSFATLDVRLSDSLGSR